MPKRGFAQSEYQTRIKRVQELMKSHDLDALFLTTEPDFRYFTGFLTRFWESPTRPWYLIVPANGDPVAVIPSIGAALMDRQSGVEVKTWQAPDYDDDGISLLAKTISDLLDSNSRIGIPSDIETHIRMPLLDFTRLQLELPMEFSEDFGVMKKMRMVKSPAEIEKIQHACQIAERAFARVPEIARAGVELSQIFRDFQRLCLEEGADYVPYLAGAAGLDGYEDVIAPATDKPIEKGDILMLDTGLVWDGYFCDFDRNFSIGVPPSPIKEAHDRLLNATELAFQAARPGRTASELFALMNDVVNPNGSSQAAGRLGHGLGMQLTEWPSLIPTDKTVLNEGMVLTLEPSCETANGRIMVHEENIVVTKEQAIWLSNPYKELVEI